MVIRLLRISENSFIMRGVNKRTVGNFSVSVKRKAFVKLSDCIIKRIAVTVPVVGQQTFSELFQDTGRNLFYVFTDVVVAFGRLNNTAVRIINIRSVSVHTDDRNVFFCI